MTVQASPPANRSRAASRRDRDRLAAAARPTCDPKPARRTCSLSVIFHRLSTRTPFSADSFFRRHRRPRRATFGRRLHVRRAAHSTIAIDGEMPPADDVRNAFFSRTHHSRQLNALSRLNAVLARLGEAFCVARLVTPGARLLDAMTAS